MDPASELSLVDISPLERFKYVTELLAAEGETSGSLRQSLRPLRPLSEQKVQPAKLELQALGWTARESSPLTRCICALLAVDTVFQDLFNFRKHVYLLGDDAVANLLNGNEPTNFPALANWSWLLEVLGTIGLIYRFNVAAKFGYSPRGLMQFRLNGWGTIVAEQQRMDHSLIFARLLAHWRLEFGLRADEYRTLLHLCDRESRPLEVEAIHQLNDRVPIRIVT